MPQKALEGVKILDMSRVLAAPLATQMLADLGADVIKVERPKTGDESRRYGPPFVKDKNGEDTEIAAFYMSCNRNKRSITVDFSLPEGQDVIRRLASECDVFVENFKTGTLNRYDLDYSSLGKLNPKLIYCSITGYGQTGPLAAKPGYDGVFQAMCGMMNVSGHPDDSPGGGPMKVGISMVDILTSLYAANAMQAALYFRDANGGEGQHIDISLLDCGFASLSHFAHSFFASDEIPERRGNGGFGGVPSQAFDCADKQIFLVAGNDSQFRRLCIAIGHEEIAKDERFSSASARIVNRKQLLPVLQDIFITKSCAEWLAALDEAGIPCSRVNNIEEAMSEPQLLHREMVRDLDDPVCGRSKCLANPIRLSKTPLNEYRAPPVLGEDVQETLTALGYSEEEISALRSKGVI